MEWQTNRRRTAIARKALSVPARQAIIDGVISTEKEILDFGCGRGDDVHHLRDMGLQVTGWDPVFAPRSPLSQSMVVLLTYVLNIIEDPTERVTTLKRAWDLTEDVLVVSTRLTWDSRRVNGERLEDGVVTAHGTFQHLYRPEEIRSLVEKVTGASCVSASPGVVYAFRRETLRLQYLASKCLPSFSWQHAEEYGDLIEAVSEFLATRGRMPVIEELPADLVSMLGPIRWSDLVRAAKRAADPLRVMDAEKKSTLNVLLFLGMEIFSGRTRFSELPLSIRLDVRRFFRSYDLACKRADRLLLKLRDSQYVRGAMRNSVGKLTPSALYVHKRAMDSMPVVLRLYEHCGAIAAGRPVNFDVLKLHHDKHAVSWLSYPEFDADPHPKLAVSYSVSLTDLTTRQDNYEGRENRPLLHRKEEFLSSDDPMFEKFQRLTRAEQRAGLYQDPSRIGTEKGWSSALEVWQVELRGHRLVKRRSAVI